MSLCSDFIYTGFVEAHGKYYIFPAQCIICITYMWLHHCHPFLNIFSQGAIYTN